MDITVGLVLKLLGGLLAANSHRTIARAAKEESIGWWVATMFVPCGSVFYAIRRGREMLALIGVMVLGFVLVGAGFGLEIYQRVNEARTMAATQSATANDEEGEDDDDDGGPQGHALMKVSGSAASEEPASSSASALPAASTVPPRLQPKLKKLMERYQELSAARANLDPKNLDAVGAFNLRAEDYRAACAQFRAEMKD